MAKQFKVKNNEFVEAAIAYFHETGQSPFTVGNALLTGMESKVEQQALETHQHTADIGNQLGAIMRDVERGLGKHLQEQQGGIMLYLQRIERTILTYLIRLEEKMLKTLLEQVMRVSAETTVSRNLVEQLLARHDNATYPIDTNRLGQFEKSSAAEIEWLVLEKGGPVLDAASPAPVFASEMPAVAAPVKPDLLSFKKAAAGGETGSH